MSNTTHECSERPALVSFVEWNSHLIVRLLLLLLYHLDHHLSRDKNKPEQTGTCICSCSCCLAQKLASSGHHRVCCLSVRKINNATCGPLDSHFGHHLIVALLLCWYSNDYTQTHTHTHVQLLVVVWGGDADAALLFPARKCITSQPIVFGGFQRLLANDCCPSSSSSSSTWQSRRVTLLAYPLALTSSSASVLDSLCLFLFILDIYIWEKLQKDQLRFV